MTRLERWTYRAVLAVSAAPLLLLLYAVAEATLVVETPMSKLIPEPDAADHGHPSQSGTDFFPLDTLIRKCGWKIHSRKRDEQAWWEKPGWGPRPQSEVLRSIPQKEVARAQVAALAGNN